MPEQLELDVYMNWDAYTQSLVDLGFEGECSVWRAHMKTSSDLFNASCIVHDVCYQRGGTEVDRMNADRGLYRRSILNAASIKKVFPMWYYIIVATTWYIAVRIVGWVAFHYGEPRTTDEILKYNKWQHSSDRKFNWKKLCRNTKYLYLTLKRKLTSTVKRAMVNK